MHSFWTSSEAISDFERVKVVPQFECIDRNTVRKMPWPEDPKH